MGFKYKLTIQGAKRIYFLWRFQTATFSPHFVHICGQMLLFMLPYCRKLPKTTFYGMTSEANHSAGNGRKVVKSPEMCSPDLVDAFCTRNRYLKPFRSRKNFPWKSMFFFWGSFAFWGDFPPFPSSEPQNPKKHRFSWKFFFDLNGFRYRFRVQKRIYEVRRTHFRWFYHLPAISGRVIRIWSHTVKCCFWQFRQ